jgi:two-component system sensor histidine kinase/response regulator
MPGISGLKVLEKLRQEPETVNVPFIFLTGGNSHDNFRTGMNLGADDFLTKPVEPKLLLQVIDTRLKKYAAFKEKSESKVVELRESLTRILPHELNTALNGILGFSDYLLEFYDENMEKEEVIDIARAINVSGKRLQKITENFLLYSSLKLLQTDHQKLNTLKAEKLSSVKEIIENISRIKAREQKREGDIYINLEDTTLNIPEKYFQKMLDELIDNAFKFSFPGTLVKIVTSKEAGRYVIYIIDHGKGFLPEYFEKIDAFVQFERDTNEQQGAGMGLVIAKMIAEVFGFELKISGDAGNNTEVKIIF